MKRILLLLLVSPLSLLGQDNAEICKTLSRIKLLVEANHFEPKPIDDSLSVFVFDTFMDALDSNRSLISKTEFQQLSKHRFLLDDYQQAGNCSFLNDFTTVYRTALERKKSIIETIAGENLAYDLNDSIRFSKEKFDFDLEGADFERIWKKRVRFDILEEISKMSKNYDSLSLHFDSLEKTVRAKVFDTHLCKINSLMERNNGIEDKLKNDFFNAFCSYFDPHSNYFSFDAKSSFISGLSTSKLSLGIDVGLNEKDEIVVQEIIPGGPAAKNGKLEKGDIIIKVSNNKDIDFWVSCSSLDAIGELIFADTNKQIGLMLRKQNGSTIEVLLKKKVMKATSNAVYSFIAEKESKVGYIKIPNFYSDFDGRSVKGCADDVAKEIFKLKKENIDGLVIDLQNNGGGSMAEAIKLAGMFINVGPISVLVDNNNNQNVLKDFNRGVVYDGPIILLMNGYSASASEFFAAALQDYNKAVVLGTTSLGKASMQTIIPIDEEKQSDFIKLTIEKFYRITGESHQIKGIVPDIFAPSLFDSLIKRENSYKTALPYNAIATGTKFSALPHFFDAELGNLSRARISNNYHFNAINQLNHTINALYNSDSKAVRLTFADVFKEVHEADSLWEKVKELTEKETQCKVYNTAFDSDRFAIDEFQNEINTFKIKDSQTNPYLEEALSIINDYKNLKK